jgi:hypothetical protein
MMKRFLCLVAVVAVSGCASPPHKIATTYVSPLQYKDYSAEEVAAELERVNRRIGEVEANLKKQADKDSIKTALGLAVFWPALLALDGDGPQAQEYARLKGERDALEKTAIQKGYVASPDRIRQASHTTEGPAN